MSQSTNYDRESLKIYEDSRSLLQGKQMYALLFKVLLFKVICTIRDANVVCRERYILFIYFKCLLNVCAEIFLTNKIFNRLLYCLLIL